MRNDLHKSYRIFDLQNIFVVLDLKFIKILKCAGIPASIKFGQILFHAGVLIVCYIYNMSTRDLPSM